MDPITPKLRKWLGPAGLAFFREVKEKHGRVDATWMETINVPGFSPTKFPHSVHFREGMQVRNFLRTLEATKGWTDHDYDNRWAGLVEVAIEMSDGMSDSRREERLTEEFDQALSKLDEALDRCHDMAFGLPSYCIEEMQKLMKHYGLYLDTKPPQLGPAPIGKIDQYGRD